MQICADCGEFIEKIKRWGYSTLCECCDMPETTNKHVGVLIADGKTDYHIQLVRNPTVEQAAKIRSLGLAHDPRTQLRFTNKGRSTDGDKK